MKTRLGLAFFSFAAVLAGLAAWEQPGLLAWLAALHNGLLAFLYTRRRLARQYDRWGLGLGLLAALLPLAATYPSSAPLFLTLFGAVGYGLILWSLITLGNRFGIAPADRGLVVSGPYRIVRHPMYLGELLLRFALLAASPQPGTALILLCVLAMIQLIRAQREEAIIAGYPEYARQVPFRLIPGVW